MIEWWAVSHRPSSYKSPACRSVSTFTMASVLSDAATCFNSLISQNPQCIKQVSHTAQFCNRNVHTHGSDSSNKLPDAILTLRRPPGSIYRWLSARLLTHWSYCSLALSHRYMLQWPRSPLVLPSRLCLAQCIAMWIFHLETKYWWNYALKRINWEPLERRLHSRSFTP